MWGSVIDTGAAISVATSSGQPRPRSHPKTGRSLIALLDEPPGEGGHRVFLPLLYAT
jgi:hypothetical protein